MSPFPSLVARASRSWQWRQIFSPLSRVPGIPPQPKWTALRFGTLSSCPPQWDFVSTEIYSWKYSTVPSTHRIRTPSCYRENVAGYETIFVHTCLCGHTPALPWKSLRDSEVELSDWLFNNVFVRWTRRQMPRQMHETPL